MARTAYLAGSVNEPLRSKAGRRHIDTATSAGRPNETAIVKLSKGCDNVRIGVLPASFFSQSAFYGPSGLPRPPGVMLTRSAKPTQRDRLRLDRYDEQDFTELVAAMRADGIWFL